MPEDRRLGWPQWLRQTHGATLRPTYQAPSPSIDEQAASSDSSPPARCFAGGSTRSRRRRLDDEAATQIWRTRSRICRTAVVYLDPPEPLRAAWARQPPAVQNVGGIICRLRVAADRRHRAEIRGRHEQAARAMTPAANRVPGCQARANACGTCSPHHSSDVVGLSAFTKVVTCAYTFTEDHTFFSQSARQDTRSSRPVPGHGYKFGAAVGRRVADGGAATAITTGCDAGFGQKLPPHRMPLAS